MVARRSMSSPQKRLLVQGALRLLRLKKRHRWEPSWFSAYGGTLEATASALTVLHRLNRRRFASHLRSGARYLLARRHAWGEWHNARGTAATLRALLELGATTRPERTGSAITIRVNGKRVQHVKIDPKDPYGSAVNLRALRLSPLLTRPLNTIEVRYSGRLTVPARLVVERWTTQAAPTPPRRRRATVVARLLAPRTVTRGRPFFAVLELTPRTKRSRATVVTLGLPTTVQLSAADLSRLRGQSKAYRARLRGRVLELHLPRLTARLRIALRLTPHLAGQSHFLAPVTTPLRAGRAEVSSRLIALDSH